MSTLHERLLDEADQARQDGATDIAALLEEAAAMCTEATALWATEQNLREQLAARVPDGLRTAKRLEELAAIMDDCGRLRSSDGSAQRAMREAAALLAAAPQTVVQECEWTNCPRRVGDVCCNEQTVAQPEQPSEVEKFMDACGLCRRCAAPIQPTSDEVAVIQQLIDLTRHVDHALDDSEVVEPGGWRSHIIAGQDFDDIVEALEALNDLPDDKPGMTLGPGGKAEWALRKILACRPLQTAPIDVVLHCPKCGMQHIDGPEPDMGPSYDGSGDAPLWPNPPHRSHLCHGCGHIWRPADVPTNGVQAVKTKGKADSPIAQPAVQGEPVAWQVRGKSGFVRVTWNTPPTTDQLEVAAYDGDTVTPLYTHPQPERVALTDEQAVKALQMAIDDVRAIGLQVEAAAHIVGYFCNRVNGIKGAQQ